MRRYSCVVQTSYCVLRTAVMLGQHCILISQFESEGYLSGATLILVVRCPSASIVTTNDCNKT
jgi:hypothetical protein